MNPQSIQNKEPLLQPKQKLKLPEFDPSSMNDLDDCKGMLIFVGK